MYEKHRAFTTFFSEKIKFHVLFRLKVHKCLADGTSSVDCEKLPFVFQQVLEYRQHVSITDCLWAHIYCVCRFMCTGLVFWVFIRHNNTPLVKASGRELCYILLSGVFMSYAMTFLFLAKPSPAICALRRLGLGTSFAVCYSALLTKTNRIARIFNGVKDGAGAVRPRFISPSSQVSQRSVPSINLHRPDGWLV